MKGLLVLLVATFGVALGVDYDALRVRFGMSQELADVEHFFSVPRYQSDARDQGWRRTQRPDGPLPDLVMFCPSDRAVCALYDSEGFIAGLQFAFLADDLDMEAIPPQQQMVRWRPWTWWWQRTLEYWTATQYFVNEETINSDTRRTTGQTVGAEGVWASGADGRLINIPIAEGDFANTDFTLQNCVHFMGVHYFYNMTSDLDCSEFVPWFALTKNDVTIGSGFITFAKFPEPAAGERDWFERPTVDVARAIIPNGPSCLYDWTEKYGLLSIHIYYIDEPWTIIC